jgi:hypothetical protein
MASLLERIIPAQVKDHHRRRWPVRRSLAPTALPAGLSVVQKRILRPGSGVARIVAVARGRLR